MKAAKGKVRLVKMNIDDHPQIAGQLGIQSIPAVIAFKDGQPLDGFMGALPESQVTPSSTASPGRPGRASAERGARSGGRGARRQGYRRRRRALQRRAAGRPGQHRRRSAGWSAASSRSASSRRRAGCSPG